MSSCFKKRYEISQGTTWVSKYASIQGVAPPQANWRFKPEKLQIPFNHQEYPPACRTRQAGKSTMFNREDESSTTVHFPASHVSWDSGKDLWIFVLPKSHQRDNKMHQKTWLSLEDKLANGNNPPPKNVSYPSYPPPNKDLQVKNSA